MRTSNLISKIESSKTRVIYLLVLCVLAYYIARTPLFVFGWYRNQIVPNFSIFTNNPIGLVVGIFWILRGLVVKPWVLWLWLFLGIVGSAILTMLYFQTQPADSPHSVKLVTFYFFLTFTAIIPLVTVLGCNVSNKLGPLIFKQWQDSL
jgi:hypothetical protein